MFYITCETESLPVQRVLIRLYNKLLNYYFTASLDYTPPTETYVIEAGEDRDCLQLMILDDSIFEGPEDLIGSLEGIVNQLGQLVRNPERITFDPATTMVEISDNDGMFL